MIAGMYILVPQSNIFNENDLLNDLLSSQDLK